MKQEPLKATSGQLEVVLRRSAECIDSPEAKLFLAVIVQAIDDAEGKGKPTKGKDPQKLRQRILEWRAHRDSARRFIDEGGFVPWCEWIGLNPEYVSELIRAHGIRLGEQVER